MDIMGYRIMFVTWKVYSQPVVTLSDLAEEGRSGMFLFDCCPADCPMSKTVRGCYKDHAKRADCAREMM